MNSDPVVIHLDLIARALEAMGYAIEVNYTTATIIVWLDEWPVTIEVKRRSGANVGQTVSLPMASQAASRGNLGKLTVCPTFSEE